MQCILLKKIQLTRIARVETLNINIYIPPQNTCLYQCTTQYFNKYWSPIVRFFVYRKTNVYMFICKHTEQCRS